MANENKISQIQVGSVTYDICDTTARDDVSTLANLGLGTIAPGTTLWEGQNLMGSNAEADAIHLSQNVSDCMTGIVLQWEAYLDNALKHYEYNFCFIPKTFHSGVGVNMWLRGSTFNYVGAKYVYIHNSYIRGNANNTATGTTSGITYVNNRWALSKVIAV